MKTTRIIRIDNCKKCPFHKLLWDRRNGHYYQCNKLNSTPDIEDISIIPEWCPLEKYKEE
jgi:hypothetical protein